MKARVAFMQLVNAAQRTLSAKIEALDPDNQYEWQKAKELRYSFMSVVVETKQLPAMAQPKALSAPRKPAPPARASGFSDDLDDDVPA